MNSNEHSDTGEGNPDQPSMLRRLRGNIYSPFAGRAKEVAWNLCIKYARRRITPTDVDALVECSGHFLLIELKTRGARMPLGQAFAFKQLIKGLRGKGILMIIEHPPLDVAVMPRDVETVRMWGYDPSHDRVYRSERLDGSIFPKLYTAFFDYAEGDSGAMRRVYRNALSEARQGWRPTAALATTMGSTS